MGFISPVSFLLLAGVYKGVEPKFKVDSFVVFISKLREARSCLIGPQDSVSDRSDGLWLEENGGDGCTQAQSGTRFQPRSYMMQTGPPKSGGAGVGAFTMNEPLINLVYHPIRDQGHKNVFLC